MNYLKTKINTDIVEWKRKIIFSVLLIFLLCSFFLYAYFIKSVVKATVLREKLEADKADLVYKIGDMEFELINEKEKVNIELAYKLGYQDSERTHYLVGGSNNHLSLNNEI